jgi:hypothetical protein
LDYSRVRIQPQPSGTVLPQLQYHFYRADNSGEVLVYPGDDRGYFEGSLPAGTYRVIATNTGAANVTFTDMGNCDEATVTAAGALARGARAESVYLEPDSVYSVVVGDLVVSASGSPLQRPAPVLLTRRIDMSFSLEGGAAGDITGLSGVLQGIYPSAWLYSQTVREGDDFDPASSVMTFDGVEAVSSDGTRGFNAGLSLFGLCDPKGDNAYENNLALTITLKDNGRESTQNVVVPLTEKLSAWFADNGAYSLEGIVILVALVHEGGDAPITGSAEVAKWDSGGSVKVDV